MITAEPLARGRAFYERALRFLAEHGPARQKARDLAAVGVERVVRTVGARDGLPLLQDGRTLDVTNVVWCTGYHAGFAWIDRPLHGERDPLHKGGVVHSQPGLYFVGLEFVYCMVSPMVHGVGRDAERTVRTIAPRVAAGRNRRFEPSTVAA